MEHLIEMIKNFDITGTAFRLIGAILILIIGFKLAKWIAKLVKSGKAFEHLDPSVHSFIESFISIILKVVVIFTAVGTLGIPMTSLVTLLGTAGVAVGLALQGGLSNIAGGIIVLIFKPYSVGDFISYGGESGTVSEINIFHTKLTTPDNRVAVIPNGSIAGGQIVNFSKMPTRRVDLTFSAAYTSDISKVESILTECASRHEKVINDPAAPFAALSAHSDSSLDFVLRAWCKSEDYWTVYFDLIKDVKNEFDKNGIKIPFPQVDVHLDK